MLDSISTGKSIAKLFDLSHRSCLIVRVTDRDTIVRASLSDLQLYGVI